MANYRAVASGNWNTAATWGGGAVPPNGAGHSIYSNTFTVTVDTTVDVALITNLANAGTFVGGGTAAAGGLFALNNGVSVTSTTIQAGATAANLITLSGTASASINGAIIGGSVGSANCITHSSSGTLTTTGTITSSTSNNSHGITVSGNGTLNATGDISSSTGVASGVNITSASATVSITGNLIAGSGGAAVSNTSTSSVTVIGNFTASLSSNAFTSPNSGATNRLSGSFISAANGYAAIYAVKYFLNTSPTAAKTRYALNGSSTYLDMVTADNSLGQAAITDVRFGTVYASGALTGVAYIPSASSVASGVPVDNTTGTATLTAANVRAALGMATANLDTQLAAIPTAITNANAVWDELMSNHTTAGTFGGRIVRSINSNNELQLTAAHHAAAVVHDFQAAVIQSAAFATSAVTLFTGAMRTELTPELTEITEVHAIHGLDIANALTVTPTSRTSGAITQAITGDGTTNTVVTRV